MNRIFKILLVAAAAALTVGAFAALPARAQDESATQQAVDIQHSSQDAANSSSDEDAKDKSNQGFDTPNNDPAPSDGN
jgi:type II secretory pathway pseudopilin PulG